jgi:hypothetical protein
VVASDGEYETQSDTWEFTTAENNPPDEPTEPSPKDKTENVSINPTLSVIVTDPDGNTMDISFYNAFDDSLIDIEYDVNNGSTASVIWPDLSTNTTYYWYANASDAEYTTQSDTWEFTTTKNNPPDKPTEPSPLDKAENVSINLTLSVIVTDPDGNKMNVTFYNASDNSPIDTDTNVENGNTASITWSDLSTNTTYYWYAIVSDGELTNQSDTWSFTTEEKEHENKPPTVKITKPEKALYLLNLRIRKYLLRLRMPTIIGKITIEANAKDEDSGIEKVVFYINDEEKCSDTTAPYTYDWRRDRLRLIHIFRVKVVAYDNEGASAEDSMIVRKLL